MLDGFNSPTELVEKAKELGHPALAITDHGSIHGYLELYKAAKKNNIKPIIGVEMYITNTFAEDGLAKELEKYHIIVLAKNEKGLKNLFQLVTLSNTEGFYYKPRITFEWLKEHSEGLIVSSACIQGEVAQNIINNNIDKAKKYYKESIKIYKSRIKNSKNREDITANKLNLALAKKFIGDSSYMSDFEELREIGNYSYLIDSIINKPREKIINDLINNYGT